MSSINIRSCQLPAVFARKREKEFIRNEKSAEMDRYYDHWGKVTSRFENLAGADYYKKAEEQAQTNKDKKEKAKILDERRIKMRTVIEAEKVKYDLEVHEMSKPGNRLRRMPANAETLEKIEKRAKEDQQLKRKLELEAKLYGNWRHGVDDNNLIFDSKSDHQVLAKLNWLDKQIDNELQREKDAAEAQARNLRLQEEMNKLEQVQKEREQIREQEVRELRALQDRHVEELKERQSETDELKIYERRLRAHLIELEKELELIEENSTVLLQPSDISNAYNLNKIKMFIRNRSENFRKHIELTLSVLKRILAYATKPEQIQHLVSKYEKQLEAESSQLTEVESWYESEAKYNLSRCEDAWQAQNMERYHEMKELLNAEQMALSTHLNDNLERQSEVLEIRSKHLAAIDNSNEQLKQLIDEKPLTPRGPVTSHDKDEARPNRMDLLPTERAQSDLGRLTDTFSHLNLNMFLNGENVSGQHKPSPRSYVPESPREDPQKSWHVVTPDNAVRPKFGRKRVVWT